MSNKYGYLTRVEVDLAAIKRNLKAIKSLIAPTTLFCAVVKADAYGHGAVAVARAALAAGADYLAVAVLDEALVLREAGFTEPVLIMGITPEHNATQVVGHGLIQAVCSLKQAQALSEVAQALGRRAKIHLKVDTGMVGRLGGAPAEAVNLAVAVAALPNLELEGIFTNLHHLDSADGNFTNQQLDSFLRTLEAIEALGIQIPLKHCANSLATLNFPKTHLDMVRVGISLYGLKPSVETIPPVKLTPAMRFKSTICAIKQVLPGIPVSYGGLDITTTSSNIATIPVGYADGWLRSLGGRGRVIIGTQSAVVVGSISMDQCLVDITGLEGVSEGDDVLLFGGPELPVEEVANHLGTVNYEVVCMIGKRVPRVYWCSED